MKIKPASIATQGLLLLSAVALSSSMTSCFSLTTTKTPDRTTTVVERTQSRSFLPIPTTTTTTRSTTY